MDRPPPDLGSALAVDARLAEIERDLVAGTTAVALGQQRHHDIALFGLRAQEIVPDETVQPSANT